MSFFKNAARVNIDLYLVFLDETDESWTFNLDGLSGSVIQGDDEMEEIRLAKIAGRLLLEMGPTNTQPVDDYDKKKSLKLIALYGYSTHRRRVWGIAQLKK